MASTSTASACRASYYLQRSAHDSTLSRVADSWVLARADRPRSWDVFLEALLSDVADIQGGTTAEGVHLGAMAGTVDVLQRCYTGVELRGDVLWLNPRLPEPLRRLRLFVRYRGHSLALDIWHDRVEVSAVRCAAPRMRVGIRDHVYELAAGEIRAFPLPASASCDLRHVGLRHRRLRRHVPEPPVMGRHPRRTANSKATSA